MRKMVYGFVNSLNDEALVSSISRYAEDSGLGRVSFIETKDLNDSDWKSRIFVRKVLSCNEADHVIVTDFLSTRLDVVHLFSVLSFCQENGIFFHSIAEGFCTCKDDERSKTIFQSLSIARDLEVLDLKRRVNLDTSKPKKGRPLSLDTMKLDEHRSEIKDFRAKGYTLSWIANHFGVSQFTMKNWAARPGNKD